MLKRFICRLLGHAWHIRFWETKCRRCGKIEQDRLYQLIGQDISELREFCEEEKRAYA